MCVMSVCVCVWGGRNGKNGMERGRKRKEEGGGTKGGEVLTAVTAVTVTRFTESSPCEAGTQHP